jgi:phosphatidylglycerol lysyltransferase
MFGAWQDDKLIAFISCHQSPDVWTLDIMRSRSDIPSGTMHALAWFAIETAKNEGLTTF